MHVLHSNHLEPLLDEVVLHRQPGRGVGSRVGYPVPPFFVRQQSGILDKLAATMVGHNVPLGEGQPMARSYQACCSPSPMKRSASHPYLFPGASWPGANFGCNNGQQRPTGPRIQDAPQTAQDDPRRPQDGLKTFSTRAKTVQTICDGPIRIQDITKRPQEAPQEAPERHPGVVLAKMWTPRDRVN